jgi:broad specificity phosphatase PhoE
VSLEQLILVRHGEADSNVGDTVNGVPPGVGLAPAGREEAALLRTALAGERIDLGVATEFRRAQETLEIALQGHQVATLIVPELNEINFGSFEGGSLQAYRGWAWTTEPDVPPPGGGETRAEVAARIACGLERLLARPERTILAVSHALPVRYVLDGADGIFPAAKIEPVGHAVPHRLARGAVETAVESLREWSAEPDFRSEPIG